MHEWTRKIIPWRQASHLRSWVDNVTMNVTTKNERLNGATAEQSVVRDTIVPYNGQRKIIILGSVRH